MTDENTELEIKEEMLFLMYSPVGRRFLRRMWDNTGVFRSDYVAGQPDNRLPYFEGQRNVGLMLFLHARNADERMFMETFSGG